MFASRVDPNNTMKMKLITMVLRTCFSRTLPKSATRAVALMIIFTRPEWEVQLSTPRINGKLYVSMQRVVKNSLRHTGVKKAIANCVLATVTFGSGVNLAYSLK